MKEIDTDVDLSIKDEEPEEIDHFDVMSDPSLYLESIQQSPIGGMPGDIMSIPSTMPNPIQNPLADITNQMNKMFEKSLKSTSEFNQNNDKSSKHLKDTILDIT